MSDIKPRNILLHYSYQFLFSLSLQILNNQVPILNNKKSHFNILLPLPLFDIFYITKKYLLSC